MGKTFLWLFGLVLCCVTSSGTAETQMPQGLWDAFNAARHAIETQGDGYVARNHRNDQRIAFGEEGIAVTPAIASPSQDFERQPGWSWGLRLTGYGTRGDIRPVAAAERHTEGTRLEYRRGPVTEWYENRPAGLEQGFTLSEPPAPGARDLVLALALQGGLTAKWEEPGQALSFHTAAGDYALTYRDLKVVDAKGAELSSRLALNDQTLEIHVDTRGAQWPVTVDPLVVNEQKVTAQVSDARADDQLGSSVALSGDTALIGSWRYDGVGQNSGTLYVFIRSGGAWRLQQQLTASDAAANDYFGYSVALDGDTALVGAYRKDLNHNYTGAAYVFTRSSGIWTEETKLTASDASEGDNFGESVALSGDRALVGASGDDDGGSYSGSAYLFLRNPATGDCLDGTTDPWCETAKLTAPDAIGGEYFGESVALDGDTALIGAFADDGTTGSAYVFVPNPSAEDPCPAPDDGRTNPWCQQQKLTASDGGVNDKFGISVALSGDTALIGTQRLDVGRAYVFTRAGTTWTQQQEMVAAPPAGRDFFGYSVALEGDRALIGAYLDAQAGSASGAAYVFTRAGTTWTQEQKLVAGDAAANDEFGYSVALSGDTALIGALLDDPSNSGSVYVFNRNDYGQWGYQAKLRAVIDDGATNDYFGSSVALSGDTALVGAYQDDCTAGGECGSAYVFRRSGTSWSPRAKLTASDAAASDWFGWSVALSGDTALVGAYQDDCTEGNDCGSAYLFVEPTGGWADAIQDAKLIAGDASPLKRFGYSVALSGDTALVGAYSDSGGRGSAYVFVEPDTGWTNASQDAKLTASDAAAGDSLGWSVALSGDTALVGARDVDCGPADLSCGSAYVFVRPGGGWANKTEDAKLAGSDTTGGDQFGQSVALSDDTALVGAHLDDCAAGGINCGSAYVFVKPGGGWVDTSEEDAKLTASDAAAEDRFGYSVALSGDTALVGAYLENCCGSAYLFVKPDTGWVEANQDAKLTAGDAAANDRFGTSVALSGNSALVGAYLDDCAAGNDCGSAYFYTFPCSYGYDLPAGQWRLIASPCSPDLPGTVASTYGNDGLGAIGTDWYLYEYDATVVPPQYVALAEGDPIDPGVGTWIKSYDVGARLVIDGGSATPVLGTPGCAGTNGCYVIPLTSSLDGDNPLWNMVGHPLPYGVDWADVRFRVDGATPGYTPTGAKNAGLLEKEYWIWNGNTYEVYDDVTGPMEGTLQAQDGFWIKLLPGSHGKLIELLIPASPSMRTGKLLPDNGELPWYLAWLDWLVMPARAEPPEQTQAIGLAERQAHKQAHEEKIEGGSEWYLRLTVQAPEEGLKDRNNVLGQLQDSKHGYDSHDLEELAPFAAPYLTIVFPHPDWGERAGDYASDFHAAGKNKNAADEWTFEVHSDDPSRSLVLSWEGPPEVLERSVLVDLQTGEEIPAQESRYRIDLLGDVWAFRWEYRSPNGKPAKQD